MSLPVDCIVRDLDSRTLKLAVTTLKNEPPLGEADLAALAAKLSEQFAGITTASHPLDQEVIPKPGGSGLLFASTLTLSFLEPQTAEKMSEALQVVAAALRNVLPARGFSVHSVSLGKLIPPTTC